MTSLVVVSAGLSNPSSTKLLADRLTAATVEALEDVEVTHVELRDLAHQLTDQLVTGFPGAELAAAEAAVAAADGLVVVTPVFSASYSGLLKTFFDVLESGALDGTPVLDIKPYVPYADCVMSAHNQIASAAPTLIPGSWHNEALSAARAYALGKCPV